MSKEDSDNDNWTSFEDYISSKFRDTDAEYHESVEELLEINQSPIDLIHQFPCFVGKVNIARQLMLYEQYKTVKELSGDIADIGVYKGKSFFLYSKLVELFEPYSATQVHGFDWFEGMEPRPPGR